MLFTELRFVLFFVAVFGAYWTLGGNRPRKLLLLAASYAFYAGWNWKFLGLILLSTGVDYTVGRLLGRYGGERARRRLLLVSLACNLGLLGLYKYYDFFVESAAEFLGLLGFQSSAPVLNLVLPVGISFYTFQTLSYTIDVYRRRLEPVRDLADFALFVAFFPQLVAGPIVRAVNFLPQLRSVRLFERVDVRGCLWLFLVGFVKKACIADNLSPVVDSVFSDPGAYDTTSNWLGCALFSVQIYCDFSGYTDMALASAGLLGYRLTENFRFPLLMASIGEFWRRWHISLSSWIKDYVYVPLGGSRCTLPRQAFNVYATFILIGLWHGAGWKYATFGAIHGTYLCVNRLWRSRVARGSTLGRSVALWGWPLTTTALLLSWAVFRGENAATTWRQLEVLAFIDDGGSRHIGLAWGAVVAAALAVHVLAYRRAEAWAPERPRPAAGRLPDWAFAFAYGAAFALALPWAATEYEPFIYFQF